MAVELRAYQRRSVNRVLGKFQEGITKVCLVIPTGGGKSVCASEIVARARFANARVLAICHRRELVEQLCGHFGPEAAAICPGFERRPEAPIQVATIQTLIASGERPAADLLIADECHHLASGGEWQALAEDYAGVKTVGLTATPSRGDGRPLGDMFDDIVVGAQYGELINSGHIVPCRVFQPVEVLPGGLAAVPTEAIKKHAVGQMFVFCRDVAHAYKTCTDLNENGIKSEVIEGNTQTKEREHSLQLFRDGEITAIVNVYTMTEGVDFPAATTCVIARTVGHTSVYLQMAGRVLRPSAGKESAVLIDLSGASLIHGLPTQDRQYSLCGKPISPTSQDGVRVCMSCGYTYPSGPGACPNCGEFQTDLLTEKEPVRIYSQELREVYSGADTPNQAKYRELMRLSELAMDRTWDFSWVAKQYKALFGEVVPVHMVSVESRMSWFSGLEERAKAEGWNSKYAFARYRNVFGCWPEWR